MSIQEERAKSEMFVKVIGDMAETGPFVAKELRESLGMDPSPGHVIDAMLKLSATIQQCAASGNLSLGMDAVSGALFLLRELAISQKYIVLEERP